MAYRLLPVLLLALLAGCVQSLHPFATDAQTTFDEKFVGTWADAELKNLLVVARAPEGNAYAVTYTDDHGKAGRFVARVAKVGDVLLADVAPAEPKFADDANDTYVAQLLPVHTFVVIERAGDDVVWIKAMDYGWFKKYLAAHPDEVKFEKIGTDRYLLTGPTEQVQAFAIKHLQTPGAYGEPTEFQRQAIDKPAPTKPSVP
jgi:hypothetical protein